MTPKPTATPSHDQFDTTVRPQDDLFGYVNHPWLAANPIPASESRWGTFYVLRDQAWRHMREIFEDLQPATDLQSGTVEQQARDFYYTGMHLDELRAAHLATVNDYLGRIDAIANPDQLASMIGQLQTIGVAGPWHAYVDADDADSSRHILRFRQGGLTLPDRDYYREADAKMAAIRDAYRDHLGTVVLPHFPALAAAPDQLWEAVFGFEKAIADISRPSADLRDVQANYHLTSYQDLQATYAHIPWSAYANALGWQPSDRISVDQPEVLAFINDQFQARPLADWKTYLKWHFLAVYYGRVSEELAQARFEFFGKVLSGSQELLPLWKRVVLLMDDALGDATGRLYAARHFPESSKRQVLDLVEAVRATYADRIRGLDWMADATKQTALEKLANMKVLIGYPDQWRDFTGLTVTRESFIDNLMAAEQFGHHYWLSRLDGPTSREDWFMHPQTVNAYHDPNRLVICFPAAILQPPFFDPTAPLAANLGGIGTVIGHEFTHGFDDQGCMFDPQGNVRIWQTDADRAAFAERSRIIIDQADAFEVLPGVTMRGALVIGESIADLGGLELAYQTLTRLAAGVDSSQAKTGQISPQQLFFINYATSECSAVREESRRVQALTDPHPDSSFRVNGILQHVDAFGQAFDVTASDRLYRAPADRARIW